MRELNKILLSSKTTSVTENPKRNLKYKGANSRNIIEKLEREKSPIEAQKPQKPSFDSPPQARNKYLSFLAWKTEC